MKFYKIWIFIIYFLNLKFKLILNMKIKPN